jgi:hypothetical protein
MTKLRFLKKTLTIKKLFYAVALLVIFNYVLKFIFQNEISLASETQIKKVQISCEQPSFNPKNNISMLYLAKDYQKQSELFFKCHEKDSNWDDLVSIDHLNVDARSKKDKYIEDQIKYLKFNFDHDLYLLSLNLNYFKNESVRKDITCYAEMFDKNINEPERSSNIKMIGQKHMFLDEYNNRLVVNKPGFYYISCIYNEKTIFENVYTIFSKNISSQMQSYLKHVDDLKATISGDSAENPMLKDLNYENCDYSSNKKRSEKLNVLIIVLDSMSSNHFKRVFPETHEYLEKKLKNNILFENFNVVGEKTFSNMLPMLTGLVVDSIEQINLTSEIDYFRTLDSTYHDLYPFIWRQYERLGYFTAYNEDMANVGIFNLVKKGFKYTPTHFYAQPFWFKYHKIKTGPHLCHNNKPTYATSLEQIKLLVNGLGETSYFSFNFLKYYTHNYLSVPPQFDEKLKEMLNEFEESGRLKKTMLILMGDHGNRLTSYFTDTYFGETEHRNPFLSIRIPHALWESQYFKNMIDNKNKLLTSFDLYKTLKQFYYLNKNENFKLADKCRQYFQNGIDHIRSMRGVSLFESIPHNRTCSNSLIPSMYCNCNKVTVKIKNEEFVQKTKFSFEVASLILLNHINNKTRLYRKICTLYEINHVINVNHVVSDKIEHFEFKLMLDPNDAIFRGNLILRNKTLAVYGDVKRLSLYRNESACMSDYTLHGFCFCKMSSTKNKLKK